MRRSLNFQPTSIQRLMRLTVYRISSLISCFAAGQADFNLYHLNLLWDSLDKWDTWSNNIFTMDFNKVFIWIRATCHIAFPGFCFGVQEGCKGVW